MRYLLLLTIILISCSPSKKQTIAIKDLTNEIFLNENSLFMVCRGTHSKSGLIAQKFNINDTSITHCGIGFIKNGSLCIYNVSDMRSKKSSLIIDSLTSFRNSSDVYYISIWECKVNAKTLDEIKKNCEYYYQKNIDFDYSFILDESNTLYCSEFCSRILNTATSAKFHFKASELYLNNELYETILKRKVLIYFPVDFFEVNKRFKKIYEWKSLN